MSAVETQTTNGTFGLDRQNYPILPGVYGQLLCLYIWDQGTNHAPDPQCKIHPESCDPDGINQELDLLFFMKSRNFTVQTPPATPAPAAPAPAGPTTNTTAVVLSKSTAISKAKKALAHRFGRTYKRGKRKRLSCSKSGDSYKCSYSFKYRKKKRRGTVTVQQTAAGVKTKIKPQR